MEQARDDLQQNHTLSERPREPAKHDACGRSVSDPMGMEPSAQNVADFEMAGDPRRIPDVTRTLLPVARWLDLGASRHAHGGEP
jgi:hypothetical protein